MDTHQIGLKFLLLLKLKMQFDGHVTNHLNGEDIIGTFYEKELQKINQKEFRIEKVIKKKVINYMSNRKVIIIHLIAG